MSALAVAAAVVLLEGICVGATLPTLSYFCTSLGASPYWVAVAFMASSAPRIAANTCFGRLSDRRGRKPVLIILMMGSIAGSIGWAIAPGVVWLAVARAVSGIFGAQATLAQAIAADVSAPHRRAASVGLIGAAFGAAMAIGPMLGGVLARDFGPASVGWLCATLEAIALALVLRMPESLPQRDGREFATPRALTPLLRNRIVAMLLGVTLFATFAQMLLLSTLGLVLDSVYRFNEAHAGYVFGVFGVFAVIVQGAAVRPLVAALGERRTAIAGSVLLVIGFANLAILPPTAGLWAATALLGAGAALLSPAQTAMLSHAASPAEQGSLLGVNQTITAAARTLGAMLGGTVYAIAAGAPFWVGAAASAVCVPLLVLARSGQVSQHPDRRSDATNSSKVRDET